VFWHMGNSKTPKCCRLDFPGVGISQNSITKGRILLGPFWTRDVQRARENLGLVLKIERLRKAITEAGNPQDTAPLEVFRISGLGFFLSPGKVLAADLSSGSITTYSRKRQAKIQLGESSSIQPRFLRQVLLRNTGSELSQRSPRQKLERTVGSFRGLQLDDG